MPGNEKRESRRAGARLGAAEDGCGGDGLIRVCARRGGRCTNRVLGMQGDRDDGRQHGDSDHHIAHELDHESPLAALFPTVKQCTCQTTGLMNSGACQAIAAAL